MGWTIKLWQEEPTKSEEVGLPELVCNHSSNSHANQWFLKRRSLLLPFGVCLEVPVEVMGKDLLLAGKDISSTDCSFRIRFCAPMGAIRLLIPAILVIFQVPRGEEALLAA
jgi:hypothetical protein